MAETVTGEEEGALVVGMIVMLSLARWHNADDGRDSTRTGRSTAGDAIVWGLFGGIRAGVESVVYAVRQASSRLTDNAMLPGRDHDRLSLCGARQVAQNSRFNPLAAV